MLDNGFKLEVEALISKDISYVTEQYVPARLRGQGLAGLSPATTKHNVPTGSGTAVDDGDSPAEPLPLLAP